MAAERPTIEVHRDTGAVAGDWDALADAAGAPPFLRPGWIDAWVAAFGAAGVEILAARSEGRLVGVLPLVRGRGALRSPTNWHTPLFGAVAVDDEARNVLCAAARARARQLLDLSFLDAADPAVQLLSGAAAPRALVRVVLRSPYVQVAGTDFDAYSASLGRGLRKELRRLERRASELGRVDYDFAGGGERLDELLAEGFALEGSGWKAESGTAIVSSPDTHRFYSDIAHWAAARGSLVLAFMRLDGRAVAFDMCIEEGGVAYVLKGGFDTDHRKLGPGTLLTHASIRRAFDRGLESYELLGEPDEYKLRWTSHLRERVRVQVFGASPAGRARRLAWTYGRRAAGRAAELLRDRS